MIYVLSFTQFSGMLLLLLFASFTTAYRRVLHDVELPAKEFFDRTAVLIFFASVLLACDLGTQLQIAGLYDLITFAVVLSINRLIFKYTPRILIRYFFT